jgi:hypothetical protein
LKISFTMSINHPWDKSIFLPVAVAEHLKQTNG